MCFVLQHASIFCFLSPSRGSLISSSHVAAAMNCQHHRLHPLILFSFAISRNRQIYLLITAVARRGLNWMSRVSHDDASTRVDSLSPPPVFQNQYNAITTILCHFFSSKHLITAIKFDMSVSPLVFFRTERQKG